MSYKSWYDTHAIKHKNIVDKLTKLNLSNADIIKYFDFDNMVKEENNFCILYKKNKKCHDIENLNCYFCGCPNFRIGDSKSYCSIDSKDGGTITAKNGFIHQDCTKCTVPHTTDYISDNFTIDWKSAMKDTFKIYL